MKISVVSLGCKVNQYESEGIMRLLEEMGHEVIADFDFADVYIINTCAVTNEAERKSRQAITRCRSKNPASKIIICGCASQNDPKQFQKGNVTYISGTANKYKLVNAIEDNIGIDIDDLPTVYEKSVSPKQVRTRAFVKIQDGCNNFCSYCLIPYLRGRSRSRSVEDIKNECEIVSKVTKEIVLTGIDISSYGKDIGTNLATLIESLKDIDCRIRLGSLEISLIDDELILALKKLKRFCPQFHLSLQSGSNSVLKKMNRHYTREEYLKTCNKLRENFNDLTLTTDVICGFPTETDDEFNESMEFVKKVVFMQVHVFGYSLRDGTKAAKFKQVPGEIIKKRVSLMEDIVKKQKVEILKTYIGKTLEVLFESEKEDELIKGHSREFIVVYKKEAIPNTIENIKISGLYKDGLI